jgi:predicted alpha/beta-fold hydrolase
MPVIEHSSYFPPFLFGNAHVQTIFPTLFRKVRGIRYDRERIFTPDEDFLDLDWSRIGANRLAIISHGLEGNSERAYVMGMVRAVNRSGWDGLAWNMRGCSGEPNLGIRLYHSGATDDLDVVIQHVVGQRKYNAIALIGFSLGGNLTFKYLGERGEDIDPCLTRAAACSVPCDLRAGSIEMANYRNRIYMKRFTRMLHEKIKAKKRILPGEIDDKDYHLIKTFKDFDDRYTAPIHGFRDAEDYWRQASCKQFLRNITIPSLLVNAKTDPFLPQACYPIEEAEANPNFFLELPESGGHVGFISFNRRGEYWFESRVVEFLRE